jgi:hypothetical protein
MGLFADNNSAMRFSINGNEVGYVYINGFAAPLGSAAAPAFTEKSSWLAGMYFPTSSSLALTSNGTERLRIASSGNVGIGTSSPSEKLEVSGNIKGTQLCIGSDCRSAWPSASVTLSSGGSSDLTITGSGGNLTLTLNTGSSGGASDANKIAKLDASGQFASAMIPSHDVNLLTSGILPISRGGTNSGATLTGNKVMVSSSGAITESAITTDQLGFLSGVSSSIQSQLDTKQPALGFTPVNKAGDSIASLTVSGALQASSLSVSGLINSSTINAATITVSGQLSTNTLSTQTLSSRKIFAGFPNATPSPNVSVEITPLNATMMGFSEAPLLRLRGGTGFQVDEGEAQLNFGVQNFYPGNDGDIWGGGWIQSTHGPILLNPNGGQGVGIGTNTSSYPPSHQLSVEGQTFSSGGFVSYTGSATVANVTTTSNVSALLLTLRGSSSGSVVLRAPAVAGSTVYTLPADAGTNGQVLATNGAGGLSWASSATSLSSCPAGMSLMGSGRNAYCIENSSRAAKAYQDANLDCLDSGYSLCSFREWNAACARGKFSVPGASVNEWVADATANDSASSSNNGAISVGKGSCQNMYKSAVTTSLIFRCCLR